MRRSKKLFLHRCCNSVVSMNGLKNIMMMMMMMSMHVRMHFPSRIYCLIFTNFVSSFFDLKIIKKINNF